MFQRTFSKESAFKILWIKYKYLLDARKFNVFPSFDIKHLFHFNNCVIV